MGDDAPAGVLQGLLLLHDLYSYRKAFWRPAGLISSLIFVLTPAVVVASRNDTMDIRLVFVSPRGLFRSIDSDSVICFWRLCSSDLIQAIKMLQAYMILPAIVFTYLL